MPAWIKVKFNLNDYKKVVTFNFHMVLWVMFLKKFCWEKF